MPYRQITLCVSLEIQMVDETGSGREASVSLANAIHELREHIDWMHGSVERALQRGSVADTVSPAQLAANNFHGRPYSDLYEYIFGSVAPRKLSPTFIGLPSTICTQPYFGMDEYRFWLKEIDEKPRLHRKDWEYFYVLQALWEAGALAQGKSGLGFAVGHEPIPAVLAKWGCSIIATDQSLDDALKQGWAQSGQHTKEMKDLERPNIISNEKLYSSVSFRNVDMNKIPEDLANFDFCWSICSFEHLGSLENGNKFVQKSIDCLKPGGVAVHTTEFNLSSNDDTIETENLSIYRRRDIEALARRLEDQGHTVARLELDTTKGFVENLVDLPPFRHHPHIRLRIEQYDCTSVGLIVTKNRG